MTRVSGLEHIGIAARDSKALKDWYVEHLDCEVIFEDGNNPPMYFIKMKDNNMFEIYPFGEDSSSFDNKTRGIRHFAFSCAMQEFEATVKYFSDLGVEVVAPASYNPSDASSFFFRDPEDNILQLIARAKPLF